MALSTYSPAPPVRHLRTDVPNIVIIMIDDAGPALPDRLS
jgi:arylsulfatase